MAATTIQLDADTQARLKALKGDLTYDEVLRLLLDLVTPEEVDRAREIRERSYEEWQQQVAGRIRKSRKNARIF